VFFFHRTGDQRESPENEKQIIGVSTLKYDESEKEDDEQSSTTDPTVRESFKYQQRVEKDTDEDASFSENEQILSKPSMSDEQQQQTKEESRPSSIIGTNEIQDDHEIISKTAESSINVSESQLPSNVSQDISPVSITVPQTEILTSTIDQNNETNQDLRTFLNTLTTHLLPDLRTQFEEETTDDQLETK
jgi:hypothetical protein